MPFHFLPPDNQAGRPVLQFFPRRQFFRVLQECLALFLEFSELANAGAALKFASKRFLRIKQQGDGALINQFDGHGGLKNAGSHVDAQFAEGVAEFVV